jgi:hypothetical protein
MGPHTMIECEPPAHQLTAGGNEIREGLTFQLWIDRAAPGSRPVLYTQTTIGGDPVWFRSQA